jgi:hypothetical protein
VERPPSSDPIQDLRTGWDTHVDFALRNPSLYRLMNSPAMRTPPLAAAESHRILTGDLERAAAQGKLRMAPEPAAQIIMSANVGVALMLVARPATFAEQVLLAEWLNRLSNAPDRSGAAPGRNDGAH